MSIKQSQNSILEKFCLLKEGEQIRIINRLSEKTLTKFYYLYFQNKKIDVNPLNVHLINMFQNLSDKLITVILQNIAQKIYKLKLGFFIRKNITGLSQILMNKRLLCSLSLNDSDFYDNLNSDEQQCLAEIYSQINQFQNENQVKNFLMLVQQNEELLKKLFLIKDHNWFNSLNFFIPKIKLQDSLTEKVLWNDLFISINKNLIQNYNPGWDLMLKLIYSNFIQKDFSHNYKTIYSIIKPQLQHRFIHQTFPFQQLYLNELNLPFYYKDLNKNQLLSSLFISKNNKHIAQLEASLFEHNNFEIDSCRLLIKVSISELFENYGLRQNFQKLMLEKRINQQIFFYGDFKDYFKSFINCLKLIKDLYGEKRLLKLLTGCDWGEDINILSSCFNGFFKIKNLKILNKEIFYKNKPKNISDFHTLIFKIIGNYECQLKFISLKTDDYLDKINGLKINKFKIIIPSNNIQLNQFSIEMGNCVRGYTDTINHENSIIINIYKENKAYANIEIKTRMIKEIKGKFNKELPNEEIKFLTKILREYQIID